MADKKLRVHNLAKELQVESQDIIKKCAAEGIELKNHMHVVSAGLAATIREWFSDGAHTTAVEESGRVDVASIRAKARPSRSKKKATADDASQAGAVAIMEAPAATPAPQETAKKKTSRAKAPKEAKPQATPSAPEVKTPTAPAEERAAAVLTTTAPPTEEPPAPPAQPADQTDARKAAASAPAAPAATSQPEESPQSPDKLPVAGPQNIPRPAKLAGPRVVRIEQPEIVDRPRPAARSGPRPVGRMPAPPARPPIPAVDDDAAEGKERGHGRGSRVPGRGPHAGEAAADARPSTRRAIRDEAEDVAEKLREWRDRDLIERRDRLAHASGRGIGGLRAVEDRPSSKKSSGQRPPSAKKDKIEMTEPILVKDFSRESGIAVAVIIKKLMEEHSQMATINTALAADVAQLMALENGVELTVLKAKTGMDRLADEFAALPRDHLAARPPVVTVLGHVDHGKTTLLDRIRKTKVAAGEAGGITQHIGAYRVKVGSRWVAFLDTPGHTAFTAMRARGTNLTDVVVLVVAADDGVMPTTVEAINHARAAKTTIVVALNKIDLPHDINKIYGQLAEHGLTPSGDWGGETDVIQVSAIKGQGIDELLAHLATLSDVMDLKADPMIPATGTVVEAQRDEGLGNVARILVREGTLRPGDIVVCGAAHGRVRAIKDEWGKSLKSAGPSTPVELLGLSDVPEAGDRFFVVDSSQRAKEIAEEAAVSKRELSLTKVAKPTDLETMLANAREGEIPVLRMILKTDVRGSVDVLIQALSEFPSDQVRLDIIHSGVGTVTESDVVLAQASEAIIVAFHVVPDTLIQRMAQGVGVDIRTYNVIYNLMDDVKKALEGLLTPEEELVAKGRAEVREVFTISRVGKVAGCFIRDGVIQRNNRVRVVRDGVVVREQAALDSLRRFKDDVKEVKAGFECGIRIASFDDLKPGDVIEAFEVVQVARKLEDKPARD